ncbi:unnamed protein product [Prorocentrum cordatum]|uniref:Uncharacterized protein n=1 Tax=Prorocentrum cordatum TaxID=2364126 RepID=A0ABN9Q0C2_9DINO|nr:unnamed protein product [Polarella glacialis]
MNTEEGVDRLGLVADDLAVACTVSTTGLLQLWSLGGPQPGALLARHDCLRGEPALRVGESDGYVLGTLYDEGSGVAHVAAGGVDGRLGLFHLNLEAASFSGLVPHGAGGGGHSGVVRSLAQLGASRRFATGGEDGLVCLWRPAGRRPASAAPAAAAGKRRRP